MIYKQLQREKILGREREAKYCCRTIHRQIHIGILTGRVINPGKKLPSKMRNAPPLNVYG